MVTTQSMLAEIGSGTAAEYCGELTTDSPPGPTFIESLDEVLVASRPHPGGSTLQRGDLVEIIGASGSGKTTVCVFLLMTTLLPASMALGGVEVAVSGRGKKAAILSPPSHASVKPALRRAMHRHLSTCLQHVPHGEADIEDVIAAALANLTTVKPQPRWSAWAVALRKLALRKDLELVVCDGFADGYWVERWQSEERRAANSMRDAWDALTYLRKTVGPVVVVTLQGLKPDANTDSFKPHLPAPYPTVFEGQQWGINLQLTLLGRKRPLQYPAETTAVEALRARRLGQTQEYTGLVRIPGGAGEAGTPRGARWTFVIDETGLVN